MILGIHVYWFAKAKAENVSCNVYLPDELAG